jgi:DNA-binding SARP family transcriptional activator
MLGPLEVAGDGGQELALRVGQVRAVLARLALDLNEVVSLDELVDAVWGESPPTAAQAALQVHVHPSRKVLRVDRIVTGAPGYLLRMDDDEGRRSTLARARNTFLQRRVHKALELDCSRVRGHDLGQLELASVTW